MRSTLDKNHSFDKIKTVGKKEIRKRLLKRLKNNSRIQRFKESQLIKEKLFSSEEFAKSRIVMFYLAKDDEVDTRLMIKEALDMGKCVVVPVTNFKEGTIVPSHVLSNYKEELEPGPFGILQPKADCFRPVNYEDLDLIIVPGVAFDKKGNRLGRGKGCYDRFLSRLPKKIPKIGLALRFQLLEKIPTTVHDFPLTRVISS